MAKVAKPSVSLEPTIHKAQRAKDGTGAVEWWDILDEAQAVDRRKHGWDIVVRGPDKKKNKEKAKAIEAAVGPWVFHLWHQKPGGLALPHFQQASGSPEGHSFYEVDSRKARKKP